jgi:hypothetical protein
MLCDFVLRYDLDYIFIFTSRHLYLFSKHKFYTTIKPRQDEIARDHDIFPC